MFHKAGVQSKILEEGEGCHIETRVEAQSLSTQDTTRGTVKHNRQGDKFHARSPKAVAITGCCWPMQRRSEEDYHQGKTRHRLFRIECPKNPRYSAPLPASSWKSHRARERRQAGRKRQCEWVVAGRRLVRCPQRSFLGRRGAALHSRRDTLPPGRWSTVLPPAPDRYIPVVRLPPISRGTLDALSSRS